MKKLTELLISYFSEAQDRSEEFLHLKIKEYLDEHYRDLSDEYLLREGKKLNEWK